MRNPGASEDSRLEQAENFVGEVLVRRDAGEEVGLDWLVARHPHLDAELRQIWAQLGILDDALEADAQRSTVERDRVGELLSSLAASKSFSERYSIEAEIGRGGMGAILRVVDRELGRPLAMKVIVGQAPVVPTGKTPPVEARQLVRFLNEAKITSQLDHPGIVPVHEVGADEQGRAYFTMKLVEGVTLADIFERRTARDERWPTARVLEVIQRVCEAMAFAHERKVIHRDLKPQNVMVGDFGEVYVMDWGLARRLDEASENAEANTAVDEQLSDQVTRTGDGHVLGTPAYMSPEQARGDIAHMGPQSDVYAIGAMLYQLIAGHAPYTRPGERASAAEILARVVTGSPSPLKSQETPAELIAICQKAMIHERDARYASVRELASDLRRFLDGRVVLAFRTGPWEELTKWVQRNKPLAASLICAVLLLVAGLMTSLVFKARAEENAALASRRAGETAEQARIANSNAERAKQQEQLAQANEVRATEKEREATQKANDVLSLSVIQDLKELEARADALWPAHPELLPKYEAWLADARGLIDGRPAEGGLRARPSLAQHEAKLAEIRGRARPLTAEQVEADRRASPSYAAWERTRTQITWTRRMLGAEPWPTEAEVEAGLRQENLPNDAEGLNELAWRLVGAKYADMTYGNEVRALIIARRALPLASSEQRGGIRDTLARALWRCGRFEEAFAEETQAIGESRGQQKTDLTANLEIMRKAADLWQGEEARKKGEKDVSILLTRLGELERDISQRVTYEFDDTDDRWWHTQLFTLVSDLRAFKDANGGGLFSNGVSQRYGWGIVRRAEFARTIEERSVSGGEAKRRWDQAISAISASPKYSGWKQTPQVGLLPIGADRASGLWEFWHVQSGDEPKRNAEGKLVLEEKMGMVLVLIPGGNFRLGAQKSDKNRPNYDPKAKIDETPYEVALDAYFLSKYEMTQGQWERFSGGNPSYIGPQLYSPNSNRGGRAWSALHPVEGVSWTLSHKTLERMGLVLPTEAQWEHGNRGSTSTVYWSGDDPETLVDVGNVADEYAKGHGGAHWDVNHESWNDGNAAHAEVGSYRANDLGLHDTHGNVWEWCRDRYEITQRFRHGDGERLVNESSLRVYRGGSFTDTAADSRSAHRFSAAHVAQLSYLGVRPARTSRPFSQHVNADVK